MTCTLFGLRAHGVFASKPHSEETVGWIALKMDWNLTTTTLSEVRDRMGAQKCLAIARFYYAPRGEGY